MEEEKLKIVEKVMQKLQPVILVAVQLLPVVAEIQALKKRLVQIGYSAEDMNKVPEGSNLGLGCGNL